MSLNKRAVTGEVPLQDKGFGTFRDFLKILLTACDCVVILSQTWNDTDPKGTNLLGEKHRSTEWSRVTGCQTFGNGRRGQCQRRGARLVFGRVGHHRSRPRKGHGQTGATASPKRGAPRSTELETAKVTRGFLASPVIPSAFWTERYL